MSSPAGSPARRFPGAVRWVAGLLVIVGIPVALADGAFSAGVVLAAVRAVRHGPAEVTAAGSAQASAGEAVRNRAVDTTLDRLNRALAAHDEAAYLAAYRGTDPATRVRAAATFAGLTAVGASHVRYSWDGSDWVHPAGLRTRYRDVQSGIARVHRQYRLAGWDPAPVAEDVALTFALRSGSWTLVGDHDLPEATTQAPPEPWALGPVSVVRTRHVLMVGDAGAGRTLRRLSGWAEQSVGTVRTLWPTTTWNGRTVVYATTSRTFSSAWFAGVGVDVGSDTGDGAAEFEAEVVRVNAVSQAAGGGRHPAVTRMVLAPGMLSGAQSEVRATFRHELTHVATANLGLTVPNWLAEGAADYTAYRRPATGGRVDGVASLDLRGLPRPMWAALRKASFRPDLVDLPADFYAGTETQVSVRYSNGWFAVMYIAQTYGDATLRKFYVQAADPNGPAAPADRERAALRAVLHTDKASFTRKVAGYARGLRRHFT